MKTADSSKTYYDLNIKATSSDTDIWLADQYGNLVQKATGILETSVLAGRYVVEFNLDRTTYPINLNKNQSHLESVIRRDSSCPRPTVKILTE